MTLCPDAEDWLTLTFLPGFGCTYINRLVQVAGSPTQALGAEPVQLQAASIAPRLAAVLNDRAQQQAARAKARSELETLAKRNLCLLSCASPQYPSSLNSLTDRPVVLYGHGDLSCLEQPALAIVGSRSATEYGKRVASALAGELAGRGITIISGAAFGIDASAHRGAIAAGGRTVAVLGCGVDVVYPPSHKQLLDAIAGQGLVVAEYPLGTQPEGFRFPARNRIISGLASAVLVVEATEKSGSLITASMALEQGREVFAVPGRIDSPKSAGTHRLIQQGACLVQTVDDILEALGWDRGGKRPHAQPGADLGSMPLSADEQALLELIEPYPATIDALIRKTTFTAAAVHALLLQLELKGYVRHLPGQQYERRVVS